jgi:hypothetical protein
MIDLNSSEKYKLTHGLKIFKRIDVLEEIELNSNDIENWLEECEDIKTLKFLRRTINRCINRLEDPNYDDDDFRSRA